MPSHSQSHGPNHKFTLYPAVSSPISDSLWKSLELYYSWLIRLILPTSTIQSNSTMGQPVKEKSQEKGRRWLNETLLTKKIPTLSLHPGAFWVYILEGISAKYQSFENQIVGGFTAMISEWATWTKFRNTKAKFLSQKALWKLSEGLMCFPNC